MLFMTHSYFFAKPQSHFDKTESQVTFDGGKELGRSIKKIQKVLKPDTSLSRQSYWYKINFQEKKIDIIDGKQRVAGNIKPLCKERLNRIIVLSGELFRLGDRHQAKYRICVEEKEQFPISKEIPNTQVFLDYFNEKISPTYNKVDDNIYYYEHNPVIEGMARGFLRKFLYYDHDFHQDNALVGENNYFYVLDHDRCFANVTRDLHSSNCYGFTTGTQKTISVAREYNNEFHVYDFYNLPIIQYRKMGNWFYDKHDMISWGYLRVISKKTKFLNEKYYSTIHFMVTQEFQKFMVNYHIEHAEDKKNILDDLENIFKKMPVILKKVSEFLDYLRANRMAAMQAVLFEFNDFFLGNRHYLPVRDKKNNESKAQWLVRIQPDIIERANQVIEIYSRFLEQLGERRLDPLERTYLKDFVKAVCVNSPQELGFVKEFYKQQDMLSFAALVDQYLLAANPAAANHSATTAVAASDTHAMVQFKK
jgi:hypothetical protein